MLGLHENICFDIVDNVLEFVEHYNNFFWKYFNSTYYLARCVDKTMDLEKEQEEKLEESLVETETSIEEDDPTLGMGHVAEEKEKEDEENEHKELGGKLF